VGNIVIDLYAKCSDIDDARKVFDTAIVHGLVSWNVVFVLVIRILCYINSHIILIIIY
jgi:pentatricopeptide repeat protein